jgi:hypothetical protein
VSIAMGLLAPWRYPGHPGQFHSITLALLGGGVAYLASGRADVPLAVAGGLAVAPGR